MDNCIQIIIGEKTPFVIKGVARTNNLRTLSQIIKTAITEHPNREFNLETINNMLDDIESHVKLSDSIDEGYGYIGNNIIGNISLSNLVYNVARENKQNFKLFPLLIASILDKASVKYSNVILTNNDKEVGFYLGSESLLMVLNPESKNFIAQLQ
jgi:hypothetical protein